MDIFLLSSCSVFLILMKASPKHIGIIARVLVNFTVTALSSVWLPRLNIVSHVDAHAVTEDVSLTADPANIPKALPSVVENPIIRPRLGNKIAAKILKKNITDMAWAISSSSASITGAAAAIAEPPQIDDPTPTRVAIFPFMSPVL